VFGYEIFLLVRLEAVVIVPKNVYDEFFARLVEALREPRKLFYPDDALNL